LFFSDEEYGTYMAVMDLYEDSVIQTVEFEYEREGYTITATGTIYTEQVNLDNCPVNGIKYEDNFPSSVSDSNIESIVVETFPLLVKLMLGNVDLILLDADMGLKDLRFRNW